MADATYRDWPFFEPRHRDTAEALEAWCAAHLGEPAGADVDEECRKLVSKLGIAGWLRLAAPHPSGLEVRDLCLAREILARHSGLADFAFAMQGLGSAAVALFGAPELRERVLPAVREGRSIAAFALTEPGAGSDVASIETRAERDGDGYRLTGRKTLISNAGIADFYTLFARTAEAPGAKGLTAFFVEAGAAGLKVTERHEAMAPHPLGTLELDGCRVPASAVLGAPGEGFKVAMATLDVFRPSVGAAALGFARRALDEAVAHCRSRRLFGTTLAEMQLTQAKLAETAVEIDAAALLVYRAAWAKDRGSARVTREAAMAKWFATEAAQRAADRAVQLLGGQGVLQGSVVEALYREVRPLRIYEGASEVQLLIIARELLR